jgi:hypothetical protein
MTKFRYIEGGTSKHAFKTSATNNRNWWFKSIKKRVLKKYVRPGQDGCMWSWKLNDEIMSVLGRMKPGSLVYVPYTGTWSKVDSIDIVWDNVYRFYMTPMKNFDIDSENQRSRVVGRYVESFVINSKSNDSIWCIYDIEHWAYDMRALPQEKYELFIEGLITFNREHGYPDYFPGPGIPIDSYPKTFEEIV